MEQQTAVEWLVEQIIRKHPIITQFLPNYNFDKEIIEQAKQMEVYQHGLFLHWFIKHYYVETINGMFAFVDATGEEVTVKEIVEYYYNETYGK